MSKRFPKYPNNPMALAIANYVKVVNEMSDPSDKMNQILDEREATNG